MAGDFRVGPADLRRALRSGDEITRSGTIDGLRVVETEVGADEPVEIAAVLVPMGRDVSVRARVTTTWHAACRRCAEPIDGAVEVRVHEVFAHDFVEGETYPFDGDEIDLEDLVRDAVALDLPLAPAPPEDDEGRCIGCDRVWIGIEADDDEIEDEPDVDDAAPHVDPRWAALDQLEDLPDE